MEYIIIDLDNEAKYYAKKPKLKEGERLFQLQEDGTYIEIEYKKQ